MDSFLLCLRVECLEQFALLQFVQSTACMSLGDPCRPSTGAAHTQRSTSLGFTVGHVGDVKEDVRQK